MLFHLHLARTRTYVDGECVACPPPDEMDDGSDDEGEASATEAGGTKISSLSMAPTHRRDTGWRIQPVGTPASLCRARVRVRARARARARARVRVRVRVRVRACRRERKLIRRGGGAWARGAGELRGAIGGLGAGAHLDVGWDARVWSRVSRSRPRVPMWNRSLWRNPIHTNTPCFCEVSFFFVMCSRGEGSACVRHKGRELARCLEGHRTEVNTLQIQ